MISGAGCSRKIGLGLAFGLSLALAGCQSTASSTHQGQDELAPEDDAPIFSSSIFGVKASPRVTRLKKVPKGGGRDQTGKPYMVRGKWYYPKEELGYVKTGTASWYGANFHGRLTANGEVYDMYHLSAAHPTFPLPSYARVTNRKNGSSVLVRVNDRGPYMHNRVLDVSSKAAEMLGFQNDGIADVKVEYVGRAPLEGDDTPMLMASYRPGGARAVDDGLPSGVMIAGREEKSPLMMAAAFLQPRPAAPAPLPRAVPQRTPSIEDLIETYDAAPSGPVPVPLPRGALLSYAPAPAPGASGAHAALSALAAAPETIELGAVDDLSLLMRVASLADGRADMSETASEGKTSLALNLRPGQDADALLKAVWDAGLTDAFVVRADER
ncbi:septal ring lytic transglycosylase RlpA family protein [Aureimonas sp. SK2]|uniref:septal ring lytic transglycosylase RlpA family protein n=1 Tax=Aureimonas sp. SK2 TaxID=3015992 RepID=UPI002443EA15|nr:septal ring lytic transglycosylase RlpA family protein [Aureimonas sp. SK2]